MAQENYTTADESTEYRSRKSSFVELSREQQTMQLIIESNEEIIFEQSRQIAILKQQECAARKAIQELSARVEMLSELNKFTHEEISERLQSTIADLEQSLVLSKIETAIREEEKLTAKHELTKMKEENKRRSLKIEDKDYDQLSKSKIVHLIDSQARFRLDLTIIPENQNFSQDDRKNWSKILDQQQPFQCLTIRKVKQKAKSFIKKFLPHSMRAQAWPIFIQDRLSISQTFYSELVQSAVVPQKVTSQILKDIDRSFPENESINTNRDLLSNLQEMLELFHCYRPDISYVQGMTYPAAIILLITLDKYKAFKCLCNLIVSNDFFRSLYCFNLRKVYLFCRTFDALLENQIPWLFEQLSDLNINSEIFLIEWFYTFFGRAFSLPTVLKIWDLMLYHGEVVFFKTALAIFHLLQDHLKNGSYEECIGTVKGFGSLIKQKKVLSYVTSSKLSSDKLYVLMGKVGNNYKDFADDDLL